MYISLKWVQNLVDLNNLPLATLCERLTLAGFEIEDITTKKKAEDTDFILDISLTANRSDLFNVKGFIRELFSIFYNEPNLSSLKKPKLKAIHNKKLESNYNSHTWEHFVQNKYFYRESIKNLETSKFEGLSYFFSIKSKELEVKTSPMWLQKTLTFSNIEPINNIIDSINFVALETGFPFFIWDLNKLKNYIGTENFNFTTVFAKTGQEFFVNLNESLVLTTNNLLLEINNKPISIVGLVNLKELEVDKSSKQILITSGLFDPTVIRKSSQSLGLRTDQSVCLEKNLTFNGLEQAFIRLTHLLKTQKIFFENASIPDVHYLNKFQPNSSVNYIQNKRPKLTLNYLEVNSILGNTKLFEKKQITKILKALNCVILEDNETNCSLVVPFARQNDLEREIDIIEEIVRMSGFTSFYSSLPNYNKVGKVSKLEKLKRMFQKVLIAQGLNEVLHYSMSTKQGLNQLELKNPIVRESSYLRKTLLNQLISKASLNKKQKNKVFEAFEIGKAYKKSKKKNIVEFDLIAGIFGGNYNKYDWNSAGNPINWFQAKGLLEEVFEKLELSINFQKLERLDTELLHPNRCAQLLIDNKRIGIFGQIHPAQAKLNNLLEETYIFELNLEAIELNWKQQQIFEYTSYSIYPSSTIDLACIINNNISFQEVENVIWKFGLSLLESIELFDYYAGSPIPKGFHSIGIKLNFRALDRTLTNDEVSNIAKDIIMSLKTDLGINFRD